MIVSKKNLALKLSLLSPILIVKLKKTNYKMTNRKSLSTAYSYAKLG